jgi:hypothetical protein
MIINFLDDIHKLAQALNYEGTTLIFRYEMYFPNAFNTLCAFSNTGQKPLFRFNPNPISERRLFIALGSSQFYSKDDRNHFQSLNRIKTETSFLKVWKIETYPNATKSTSKHRNQSVSFKFAIRTMSKLVQNILLIIDEYEKLKSSIGEPAANMRCELGASGKKNRLFLCCSPFWTSQILPRIFLVRFSHFHMKFISFCMHGSLPSSLRFSRPTSASLKSFILVWKWFLLYYILFLMGLVHIPIIFDSPFFRGFCSFSSIFP